MYHHQRVAEILRIPNPFLVESVQNSHHSTKSKSSNLTNCNQKPKVKQTIVTTVVYQSGKNHFRASKSQLMAYKRRKKLLGRRFIVTIVVSCLLIIFLNWSLHYVIKTNWIIFGPNRFDYKGEYIVAFRNFSRLLW